MPTVADVLRRYGPAYLERFGTAMPAEHKKVLATITACRTGQLGTVIYQSAACGTTHAMGRSCGNRHCPTCEQDKAKARLENQIDRRLPCPYILLTFTGPAGLRGFVRRHQRVAYAAIFEASSAAIKTQAADPKYVGTHRCGFFGVPPYLGPHARLPSSRSLRRPRRRNQPRRLAMARLARRLLRSRESPVDPLPCQVPRCP
jgi:Transposase zinc-binding domain